MLIMTRNLYIRKTLVCSYVIQTLDGDIWHDLFLCSTKWLINLGLSLNVKK
jgi:hypothetical protein